MSLLEIKQNLENIWFMNTKLGKNVENPIKTQSTEELRTIFINLKKWK